MMDTDKVRNCIAIGLVLYACVNVLMKFMPDIATQLPLPVYEFFYAITVKSTPCGVISTGWPPGATI